MVLTTELKRPHSFYYSLTLISLQIAVEQISSRPEHATVAPRIDVFNELSHIYVIYGFIE